MQKNKKTYLKSYILQQSKIKCLQEMILNNPSKKSKYAKQIKNCQKIKNEIEKTISALKNETLKTVLFQKYILGKTHEEIGIILNYSTRHVERLHCKALEALEYESKK